jgi:nitroimidazol reductase NimA-like FMN-containing flavoprotein (pyridoxamine 5'-phosphate oxidase superfamily)
MRVVPIRRHAERAVPDEAAAILAQGYVAHVGFVREGQPIVIPFTYHYDPDDPEWLYLHGAKANEALAVLAAGSPVCVTVTLLDGLVYSRAAGSHSVNYRSVVCQGVAEAIEDRDRKNALLEGMIARYFPGRTASRDYSAADEGKLRSTAFIAVHINAWSAKARRGGPTAPQDSDPDALGTCGVIEL